ncbi:MAG: tRNA (adenosine(37)-N6)-threonylcarbamoyltransferase complex ATPase subunit type 1 TsaE, partial [Bacillota bacterium]
MLSSVRAAGGRRSRCRSFPKPPDSGRIRARGDPGPRHRGRARRCPEPVPVRITRAAAFHAAPGDGVRSMAAGEQETRRRSVEVESSSPEETRRLARRLGAEAGPGQVFALSGPLGAGKTEFARGLLEGLGVPGDEVASPTFTLINQHQGRLPVVHIDVYRLEDPGEIWDLGLDDALEAGAVAVIEWAERLGRELPAQRLHVYLDFDGGPHPAAGGAGPGGAGTGGGEAGGAEAGGAAPGAAG